MTSIDYILGKTIYDPITQRLIVMGDTFDEIPLFIKLDKKDVRSMENFRYLSDKGIKLKQKPKTREEICYKKSYNHIYHRKNYSMKLAALEK